MVPWLFPLGLLLTWQVVSGLGLVSERVLPSPLAVLYAASGLFQTGELLGHLATSFSRAALGFLLGGSIGLLLGLLTGVSRTGELFFDTSLQMLRTIPHLSLVPLVILWLGVGEEAKVFLVALGVLFPIYLNTRQGFRTADPHLVEMGQVYGLRRSALFRLVLLPGALPDILLGVRYALGVMWLTLIVAETIAATRGIGYLATTAREFMQTDVVLLCIVLYALLGKIADVIARRLEQWCLPWHPTFASQAVSTAAAR